MRLPSLIRLPSHQRFKFQARHYDPVKEEIEERVSKIKHDMELEQNLKASRNGSAIHGSFRAKSDLAKGAGPSASGIQLMIALFLIITVFGWLYYGNDIFYSYTLLVPVIVWSRSKNMLASVSSLFAVVGFSGLYLFGWQFPFLREFVIASLLITAYFWFKGRRAQA
ncbi:MAG: hypothetical protein RIC80_14315 [Cyclobacteriaceae bacterium]